MTWTARATVQDVGEGPAPINVLATANADDTYSPYDHPAYQPGGQLHGSLTEEQKAYTQSCVMSNTEGRIRSVELRIVLDEDETKLKPGDVILVTGHFG